jgi:hypothetical protein
LQVWTRDRLGIRGALVALLVLTARASADDVACRDCSDHSRGDLALEGNVGVARTWTDAATQNAIAVDASFGAYAFVIGPRYRTGARASILALRGHVDVGHGPSAMTSLGIELREVRDAMFFGIGPAFAHLQGPDSVDALAAALDLRAGFSVGDHFQISIDAMPMYAFANGAVMRDRTVGAGIRAAFSVGIAY